MLRTKMTYVVTFDVSHVDDEAGEAAAEFLGNALREAVESINLAEGTEGLEFRVEDLDVR